MGAEVEDVTLTLDLEVPRDIGGGAAPTIATFQAADDATAFNVLDKQPIRGVDYDAEGFVDAVDFGRLFSVHSDVALAEFRDKRRYSIRGRAELQYWERFIELAVGGREPFYQPTWRNDLAILFQPTGAPTWAFFSVADESEDWSDALDYVGQWWTAPQYKNLRINTVSHGYQYRKVVDAVDVEDGSLTLEVDPALTTSSVITDIAFLERVRLAVDAVRFEHHGPRSFVELETRVVQS